MSSHTNQTRQAALRSLLDDPSPTVRAAVRTELVRMERQGIDFLRAVAKQKADPLALIATRLLDEIGGKDSVLQFEDFIDSFQYELETGALMLARAGLQDCDITVCRRFLDEVAFRCRELIIEPSSPSEQCKVLNRVIFHEYGFSGAAENFYDPANSFLPLVLERRRGLPITLSIVYLLVADRCGIQLEPVGVPGRFMVGCFLEDEPFYIDVFEGGAFREQQDIHVMLRSHAIPYDDSYFMPTPVGEVLCRCCRNLIVAYERSENVQGRDLFRSFVDAFEDAYRRHAES